MAISRNLYTRGLRQRLGGAVWYTRKGQTVARELAASVANPQTTAQMDIRVGWNNKVQFYKRSSFWMKWGAFESKNQSWSDYNAFMSANAKKVDVAITKEQAAAGYAVVADYVVTKGSLPTVNMNFDGAKFVSDIYFGADADFDESSYVSELSQMLLDNNNGLQAGDQLSFIVYLQSGNADAPTMICRAFEMILDTEDTTPIEDIFGSFLTIGYEGSNGSLSMQFSGQGGATIIVSREVNGKLKVSSQTLVLTTAQQAFLAQFTTTEARRRAARSYGSAGVQNFLSAGYSNISSGDAPISVNILSVNGSTAGEVAHLNNDSQAIIVFSQEVNVSDVTLRANLISDGGVEQSVALTTQTTGLQSSITFTTVSEGPLGGYTILSIAGTIAGSSVAIEFTSDVITG